MDFFCLFSGTEFNNQIVDKLFEKTGVCHAISSAYHPQTNVKFFEISFVIRKKTLEKNNNK